MNDNEAPGELAVTAPSAVFPRQGAFMAINAKRTFSLPPEQTAFIDAHVASGSFASASEVMRGGLLALKEREPAVENWLHGDVASACDRWVADPSRRMTSEEMAERMRKRPEAREIGRHKGILGI